MTWHTTDTGTKTFSSSTPGWKLVVWGHDPHRITVDAPSYDIEVDVTPEGIEVLGERNCGYEVSARRVEIPWDIIREIIAFHDGKRTP